MKTLTKSKIYTVLQFRENILKFIQRINPSCQIDAI